MKKTVSIIILVLILCLGLVACGSDEKTTSNNDTKNDIVTTNAATDVPSYESTSTPITMPDLNLNNATEEKAIFTMTAGGETDEVKVYYKQDVIQSITLTSKAPADGRTKDELNQLKDQLDASFAEISKKDFVSYSCVVTDEEISIVMACNDLEVKANLKDVADMGLFEGLTEDTTYTQLVKILEVEGFKKQ